MDVVELETASSSGRRRVLDALADSPWFAYVAILILQIGILGIAWRPRDLSGGDTSSYFLQAWNWHEKGQVNIAWSPLYAAFYGSMLDIKSDVVAATVLHRALIVVMATLLVLAVLRRLAPAPFSWAMAVWWAVLPINFDTKYEVHLFALLPVLAAWLSVLAMPGVWGRGLCLSLLGSAALLVRAELGLACVLFGLACVAIEWRACRGVGAAAYIGWTRLAAAYAIPLAGAASLFFFFNTRSTIVGPHVAEELHRKHTLNMAQVFTYGYKQRHPEMKGIDPWTGYHDIMRAYFDNDLPTLREMVARNPAAVWDHFRWNCLLTPHGLQVLLFNATSGCTSPDYGEVPRSRWVNGLSLLVCLVWLSGTLVVIRHRLLGQSWMTAANAAGWTAILAVAAVAVPVILTQRPRPSYLFNISVPIMAWTGVALTALAWRLGILQRLKLATPALMAFCVIGIPPLFLLRERPTLSVRTAVQRMMPYAQLLREPDALLLQFSASSEVLAYVAKSTGRSLAPKTLPVWPDGVRMDEYLAKQGVTLLYLNEKYLCKLQEERPDDARAFLAAESVGAWQLLDAGNATGDRFRVYYRLRSHPNFQNNVAG